MSLRAPRVNNGYFAGAQISASAGKYSHIYLFNPAASGKLIYVDRVYAWSDDANGSARMSYIESDPEGFLLAGKSKILGADDATGLFEFQQQVAELGTSIYASVSTVNGVEFIGGSDDKSDAILINPGFGLSINGASVEKAVSTIMEWREYSE